MGQIYSSFQLGLFQEKLHYYRLYGVLKLTLRAGVSDDQRLKSVILRTPLYQMIALSEGTSATLWVIERLLVT